MQETRFAVEEFVKLPIATATVLVLLPNQINFLYLIYTIMMSSRKSCVLILFTVKILRNCIASSIVHYPQRWMQPLHHSIQLYAMSLHKIMRTSSMHSSFHLYWHRWVLVICMILCWTMKPRMTFKLLETLPRRLSVSLNNVIGAFCQNKSRCLGI